jgi:glutamine amidotransferase PdxT
MKPTIALFIADPKCSVQSSNGIMKALGNKYTFKIFSKNELEENFFDNVDMIIVPGGFGDSSSYKNLFKHNVKRIKKFVKQGGKYLGICMGGYWAGRYYLNILDNIDTVQYIRRPNTDTRRPHAKNIKIDWYGIDTKMFFYDGCAVVGDGDYETIATYANGDPMAVIQKNIGIIGCHPESEQFWYDSYSWLKGKYHNGEHHKLLLEFTNRLMEK